MTDFQVGDLVRYSGSLTSYHPYDFTILDLFEFQGVPCARLQGPKFGIWIERCRVSNLTHTTPKKCADPTCDEDAGWWGDYCDEHDEEDDLDEATPERMGADDGDASDDGTSPADPVR